MFTDFRLKIRHFFRKNSRILLIVISIWVIVFIINRFLKNYEPEKELQTTYEPHQSVMDPGKKVPESVSNPIEDMIEEYMGYCNEGNYQKAFNMLSPACQEYSFQNSVENFMAYILDKMPNEKKYAIQDFSNEGNTYIYQLKFTDDILATGLTNTVYQYNEEKMIFKKQKDGSITMAVGNFVDYGDIKNIFENDYIKVDVKNVIKYYTMEAYTVKITNRTDNTVVISDGNEGSEISLKFESDETRNWLDNGDVKIVLEPGESSTYTFEFRKFYDSKDDSQSLIFNSVRVMENYSGTDNVSEEVQKQEIQDAIAKFSVNVSVTYEE